METSTTYLQSAINAYERQKKANKKWREVHKDKANECAKRSYEKMRNDPERYAKYLERLRNKYAEKVAENSKKENIVAN